MYPKIDKKVYERTLEDYREMAWGDARCNWCMNQWGWNVKSSKYSEICPEFRLYAFFSAIAPWANFTSSGRCLKVISTATDSEKLLEDLLYLHILRRM